jgi:flagellar biosynthesis GTPase FlhF
MRWTLIFIFFLLGDKPIQRVNEAINAADWVQAIELYDQISVQYPELVVMAVYNQAICWHRIDSIDKALKMYNMPAGALIDSARAVMANNAGVVLSNNKKEDLLALEKCRNALRLDYKNELARWNYELLKRRKQQQQQDQPPPNDSTPDTPNNNKKPKPDNNQENQPANQNLEKGQNPPLTQELALQLLEAMRQNEKQFLQQLRKQHKSKERYQETPDW